MLSILHYRTSTDCFTLFPSFDRYIHPTEYDDQYLMYRYRYILRSVPTTPWPGLTATKRVRARDRFLGEPGHESPVPQLFLRPWLSLLDLS